MTLDDVWKWYVSAMLPVGVPNTTQDFFLTLMSLAYSVSDVTVFMSHMLVVQSFLHGQRFAGTTLTAFINMVGAMYNDPDSDWVMLCDCGWAEFYDFGISKQGWDVFPIGGFGNTFGNYPSPQVRWTYSDNIYNTGQYWRAIAIKHEYTAPVAVESISLNYNIISGGHAVSGNYSAVWISAKLNGAEVASASISFDDVVDGESKILAWSGVETVDEIEVFIRSSMRTTAQYHGSCKINSISVTGTGNPPQ